MNELLRLNIITGRRSAFSKFQIRYWQQSADPGRRTELIWLLNCFCNGCHGITASTEEVDVRNDARQMAW